MKRNKFSLSHYKLLTCDMGYLLPMTWFETIPGDTIQQSTSALIRCSPLLAPVMHPVVVRINHFFVPYRLIWDDFEDFITGGPDGTSVPVHPYKSTTTAEGDLHDYLGIPPGTTVNFSALPHRAYQLIYNEYYRDQDLTTAVTVATASGADGTTPSTIQNVCWEKDYFTTSRPWDQKGNDIYVPLYDEQVPVQSDGTTLWVNDGTNDSELEGSGGATNPVNHDAALTATNKLYHGKAADVTATGLEADLTSATGIPLSELRLATALQRYQEARAQYGSRYVEYLRYLGVRSSDARLQNPEYLGGGRQTIQFSEVLSTDGTNTGQLKGHGISAMKTNRYRRFFEEHGIVMSLMSVIPKAIYTQAINRKFLRTTKEEYFQKELQTIGEQIITNKEVLNDHSTPNGTFGYQARYDEYRSHPSGIAGEFHTTNNHWHYGRIHTGDVSCNESFVKATPTKRVNASTSTDCLYIMGNHSIQARRPIMKKAISKI